MAGGKGRHKSASWEAAISGEVQDDEVDGDGGDDDVDVDVDYRDKEDT